MKKSDFINKVFITSNFKETQKLGRDFAKVLEKGDVLYLYGDLGSGKTTFVQGLAEGLGVKQRIISPTFIIVRSYKLEVISFYHIDLYRINNEKDVRGLGLEEIIDNPENIVVIEWADKFAKEIKKLSNEDTKIVWVKLEYGEKKNERRTRLCNAGGGQY